MKTNLDLFAEGIDDICAHLQTIKNYFLGFHNIDDHVKVFPVKLDGIVDVKDLPELTAWMKDVGQKHRLMSYGHQQFSDEVLDRIDTPGKVHLVISFSTDNNDPAITLSIVEPVQQNAGHGTRNSRHSYQRTYRLSAEYNAVGNDGTFGMMYRLLQALNLWSVFHEEVNNTIAIFAKKA